MERPMHLSKAEINQYEKSMDSMRFAGFNHDIFGPYCTWIMVVPGRYFHVRYAKDLYGQHVKLPIRWLERHREHFNPDMRAGGFVREYGRHNIFTYEKRNTPYFNNFFNFSCNVSRHVRTNCLGSPRELVESSDDLPLNACCSDPTVIEDNPSSWQRRSGLEHCVNKFAFGSISDECSTHGKVAHLVEKESKVDSTIPHHDKCIVDQAINLNKEEETHSSIVTVGKRLFWKCQDLSGPITCFISDQPMRETDVEDYVILQCDSMQQMPYRCKGCCFMLFDGLIWNCCVIISFTQDSLQYNKFKENSSTLDKKLLTLDVSSLMKGYVFKFVNVFHQKLKLLKKISIVSLCHQ